MTTLTERALNTEFTKNVEMSRKGTVKTIWTDLATGETWEKQLEYKIEPSESKIEGLNDKLVFYLIGGPTGYESFYLEDAIEDFFKDDARQQGWCACMGTSRHWDQCMVPLEEMRRALAPVMKLLIINYPYNVATEIAKNLEGY